MSECGEQELQRYKRSSVFRGQAGGMSSSQLVEAGSAVPPPPQLGAAPSPLALASLPLYP